VISLSPALSDVILALGARDLLVGADRYSLALAGMAGVPSLGGLFSADLERRSRPPAARSTGSKGPPSPSLPMRRVATAPAAVLPELDPVGRVPLGLLRLIVAPLALGASQRDRYSNSGGHFFSVSVVTKKGAR